MKKALLFITALNLSACSMIDTQDTRNTRAEWKDTQLVMEVAGVVNKAPFQGNSRLNAASYDGNVLLMGQAQTESLKETFLEKVRKINGVKRVYDQIRIKPALSLSQVSKDSWLTAKVKTALIGSKKLRKVNIKVITEDSEVFLLGYLTPEQATEATEITRNISGVKQVIKGFSYIAKPTNISKPTKTPELTKTPRPANVAKPAADAQL